MCMTYTYDHLYKCTRLHMSVQLLQSPPNLSKSNEQMHEQNQEGVHPGYWFWLFKIGGDTSLSPALLGMEMMVLKDVTNPKNEELNSKMICNTQSWPVQQDPQGDHVINIQQHVSHRGLRSICQVVDGHRLPPAHFNDPCRNTDMHTQSTAV